MNANKNLKSSGIGFCEILTIAFIVLKLTHYIDWSWWWILSPLWIPIIVILAFKAFSQLKNISIKIRKD